MKKWIFFLLLFSFGAIGLMAQETNVAKESIPERKMTAEESTASEESFLDSEQTPWLPAANSQAAGVTPSRGKSVLNTVKNIFFFVIVLAILFFFFRILKKVSNGNIVGDDLIQLLSTKQLSGNRYLHVVKLGDEYFLLSSAEGNVCLIKQIENQELITEMQIYKEKNAQPDHKNFIDRLRFALKSDKGDLSVTENLVQTVKKIKNRTNKMKKM